MTARERQARTEAADATCAAAFVAAGLPSSGAALVAVGGYGRSELAPYSDLDVVLVGEDDVDLGEGAERVWYPLWDSGTSLDHSVRTFTGTLQVADEDLRVALGLLDVRHLAGDSGLTLRLRSQVLARWRRTARARLPELRRMVDSRHALVGELAHVSVPDVKEAEGGLRDATVLKALVATWLVDVPHVDLERSRLALLDARDVLHEVAGRATDRVGPEAWAEMAARPGAGRRDRGPAAPARAGTTDRSPVAADVAAYGRRAGAARVDDRAPPPRARAAGSRGGAGGRRGGAVGGRTPARDPLLLLRAAALAAERDVELAPATAARLVRESPDLPVPWPDGARQLLVRLLASGRGLRAVWETLEETGALDRLLPEWERIRLLPHASVIHRFTVDRHLVETCIEASELIRQVARPDVLMVAALLHDIGKGELTEHSVAGEPIARAIAARIGFDEAGVDLVGLLVRSAPAARRDRDHPRPGRPGDGRLGGRAGGQRRGAVAAARADRGGRAGDRAEGLVELAGRPGGRRGHAGRGRVRGRWGSPYRWG